MIPALKRSGSGLLLKARQIAVPTSKGKCLALSPSSLTVLRRTA